MKTFLNIVLFLVLPLVAHSQDITQTLRGTIYDQSTHEPLIGATIVVQNSQPVIGTTTDEDGNFSITNLPLGRVSLEISYIGYESRVIPEVLITSAKEVVLSIALKEAATELEGVEVVAGIRKEKALNAMATVSARTFSVEETQRYAGGLSDPARLASAFAGVSTGNLQDNSIVVRGNAPQGVQWRLEGVEIPSPQHFSGGNVIGGGLVTLFSNQVIGNSDFLTGAFPAEYGNALAAVFDVKMRTGNTSRYEHTAQVGILGLDFASEGPLSRAKGSSYLFNYRYSTLGLLSDLKINKTGQRIKYQDLSFKLNFPTEKAGTFSLWGIGGIDNTHKDALNAPADWKTDIDRVNNNWDTYVGTVGLRHQITAGERSFVESHLAFSGTDDRISTDYLSDDASVFTPDSRLKKQNGTLTLATSLTHKFSPLATLKVGISSKQLFYKYNLSAAQDYVPSTYARIVNSAGNTHLTEGYAQLKYQLSPSLLANVGLRAHYFGLSKELSLESRAGLAWKLSDKHSLSFGYGKHSQPEDLNVYMIEVGGVAVNKDLKLSDAHHFVLGYDWMLTDKLRFKAEAYYQYLWNIPGEEGTSYSLINLRRALYLNKTLVNNTKGRNYGIDLTLERFLGDNYYYLITGSIFKSEYKAGDNVWRNTRYNKGFVLNALFGKEFYFANNRKVLDVNTRVSVTGGERYSPILESQSVTQKRVIYDESRAFSEQFRTLTYADLTVNYRINHRKSSSVFSFQMKNVLGAPIYIDHNYNYQTGQIELSKATLVIPNISYKIEF
ncbi:TonB-dependent receptor [Capnocytophaga periodontitidis]|uniref:TonB-dependent receptor n=1 Tax=Capnocytophaga periodontitidis TaxID=2795027 RepID=UPI0018E13094|nr:carboxypeptidase-like regulatory domain-containing protein [Capnocytophaga periodontitidis]MBI1668559.1 TonB-dependent receptor [Capnocytophaga periodontitidis]